MEVVFRCSKAYMKGRITHCGGGGSASGMKNFKTAVEFWNSTFNIDFFTIRKRMRRISYEILANQPCIKKINILRPTQYQNTVYAPMDDDDIFLINESEYEECISNFDENCNLIILGWYDCKFNYKNNYVFNESPNVKHPMGTNNFLFNYEKSKNYCDKWTYAHNRVHEQPYVKFKEMKHIVTSVHLVHPCSITLLNPRWVYHKEHWNDTQDHRDLMEKLIYEYVNETNYRSELPTKFWSPLESFKNLFSEVKFK